MANTYQTGTSATKISLKIDVGTAATCNSTVFLKSSTAASQTKFTVSMAADNGSIPATDLGAANTLNGYMVAIQSIADFSALPASVASDIAADNTAVLKYLPVAYTFDGGTAGEVTFAYLPADCVINTSGTLASIVLYVSLTA